MDPMTIMAAVMGAAKLGKGIYDMTQDQPVPFQMPEQMQLENNRLPTRTRNNAMVR